LEKTHRKIREDIAKGAGFAISSLYSAVIWKSKKADNENFLLFCAFKNKEGNFSAYSAL